jgi:molecular chaperone GrpE (heat shock protein)
MPDEENGRLDIEASREPPTQVEPQNAAVPDEITTSPEKMAAVGVAGQELTELVRALEESNRISAERERLIDRLYEENQGLRAGELQQALMPILRDLMRLFDDLQKTAAAYSERPSLDSAQVLREWEFFRDSALDILSRHGVEPCAANEGSSFDPREQRVCGTVATTDQSQDRKIVRVIRLGFRTETRILRTADVEVYRATSEGQTPSEI